LGEGWGSDDWRKLIVEKGWGWRRGRFRGFEFKLK